MQFVKKITTATVGLTSDVLEAATKGKGHTPVDVMQAYGFITGSETGKTTFGAYTAFTGEFEAVNMLTGEKTRSGKLILTDVATSALLSAMGGEGRMKFGLVLMAIENPRQNNKGQPYKFAVRNLLEPTADDELTKLAKGLPAPKKAGK
jgi:hypothetical protein